MKIWLDPNSPMTNLILGATLFGGDPLAAAAALVRDNPPPPSPSTPEPPDDPEDPDEPEDVYRCTHVGAGGERCNLTEGHEEYNKHHEPRCDRDHCCVPTSGDIYDELGIRGTVTRY